MGLTAIALITLSAVLHASWNLLSKNERPSAAFFLVANLIGVLALSPLLVFYGDRLIHWPASVWFFLGLTGFFQALYMVSLAGAYRHGDLSVAYPLIRSTPILVVMAVVFFLGRGDEISGRALVGVILVVVGGVLLPMRHYGDFRLTNYLNPSSLLGMLAACGTAGYSIVDDEALRLVRELPGSGGGVGAALVYAFAEGVSSILWLTLYVLPNRRGQRALVYSAGAGRRNAFLTGLGMYATYPLILVSMAYADNISYVVAFRQISIPMGVVLGVLVLGEPRYAPKFWGAAVVFAGLLLVGGG